MHSTRIPFVAALLAVLVTGLLLSCSWALAANTAPGAPQNVQVTDVPNDAGTALHLAFGASADDGAGASDVVSYKVFKRLPGGVATYLTPIPATGAASYGLDITGLTAGQQWGIGVLAWDGSLGSTAVVKWVTPVNNFKATVPGAAQNVQVTDVPNDAGTALRLTFSRSADDGAGVNNVVSYKVFKRLPGGTATYLTPITATGAATYTLDVTGLTAGQQWGIGVQAWTGSVGSTAVVVWATPVNNLIPAPPASLTVSDPAADQGDTLAVSFAKSPNDVAGGSVTGYTISLRTQGKAFAPIANITATRSATYGYVITGLTRGISYGIGVRATDGTHFSAYVIRWAKPQDTTAPQPPSNVTIANPANGGVTMTMNFSRSADDSATGDVVAYRFFKRTATGTFTNAGSLRSTHADTYTFTFRSLTPGVRYAFAVAAFDGVNESTKVVLWGDTGVPGPPQNVQLLDVPGDDGNALRVTFGKSADDGAGANDVTGYRVYSRTASTPLALVTTIKATGAATYQYILQNLTKGTKYGVAVAAYDGFQESAKTVIWQTPVDNTPPAAATGLAVADWPNDDGTALAITFNASTDDSSANPEVARYQLYRGTSQSDAGTKIADITATQAASYSYKDTGLTASTTYWYWVVASGASGASTPTARVTGTPTDQRPVAAPSNLTAADHPYDSGGVIDLTWSKSADDGAGRRTVAKYYIYRVMANVTADPTKIGEIAANSSATYAWSDTTVPMNLILYDYTVKAVAGSGALSAATAPARADAANNNVVVFQPPTNLTVVDVAGDTGGQLLLTWYRSTSESDIGPPPPPPVSPTKSISAKGSLGGTYDFYRRTATGTYPGTPSFTVSAAGTNDPMTYVDTGLTNGVTYYYKVLYRRYNQISNFTSEVGGIPVANRTGAAGASADGTASGSTDTAASPSVTLQSPPTQVTLGQNAVVKVVVNATGSTAVCLEYTISGAVARTAAAVGTGAYQAALKLGTASLPAGTAITVRARLTGDGFSAVSAPATITVVAP